MPGVLLSYRDRVKRILSLPTTKLRANTPPPLALALSLTLTLARPRSLSLSPSRSPSLPLPFGIRLLTLAAAHSSSRCGTKKFDTPIARHNPSACISSKHRHASSLPAAPSWCPGQCRRHMSTYVVCSASKEASKLGRLQHAMTSSEEEHVSRKQRATASRGH